MSNSIHDLAEWKEKYTFLEEFWNTYNEFDNSVDSDENKYNYESVCKLLMDKLGEDKEEHKKFCFKLIRNLGCYPPGSYFFDPSFAHCKILDYWIYNSVKNQNISNNLITKCFDDYKDHMRNIGKSAKCYYYPYENNYNEPMNMIILEIFQSNMNTVTDMLDKENYIVNGDLQKYICECVKIYNEMNKKYCHREDQKRTLTCNTLDAVKQTYNLYLSGKEYKKYKIPSLDNVEEEYTDKCLPHKPKLLLAAPGVDREPASASLTVNVGEQADELYSQPIQNDEKDGNSMTRTVSTAVGTMAGASSIIALLYKFTPGRNWMRSGIRGSRGRISNNLYAEQPNDVFYDGFEGDLMSSYNPTYNVGYGSV